MEAPDYCFAFNFLRCKQHKHGQGLLCAAERGQHTQPPPDTRTHPKQPPAPFPPALPCCCGYLQRFPPRRPEAPRAREAADGGAPAFWLQRGGAAGAAGTALPWARRDPAQNSPRCLQNRITHARKSAPVASREPGVREEITAPPSGLEGRGSSFPPQAFGSKPAEGAFAGGKLALATEPAQKQPRDASQPPENTPLSAGGFKVPLPSPEPKRTAQAWRGLESGISNSSPSDRR